MDGSYRYKVEEYTSGPNSGLLKVNIEGKLIGPEDEPTVIIVEGDLEIADFSSNMAQIENVYFVVNGQVEFTNYISFEGYYYKIDSPGNIKTVNSFIYAAKDFKWKVIDNKTEEREAANKCLNFRSGCY